MVMAVNGDLSIKTGKRQSDNSPVIIVRTPYAPAWSPAAKALGGRWNAEQRYWLFDPRDTEAVRALCLKTFGIDPLASPDEAPELATVRVRLVGGPGRWNAETKAYEPPTGGIAATGDSVWLFGREIAYRGGRDYAVRLGAGVVIVAGAFPSSGGSAKHPTLGLESNTYVEVEIRDVPQTLIDALDPLTRSAITIVATADPAQAVREVVVANGVQRQAAEAQAAAAGEREADPLPALLAQIATLSPAQRQQVLSALLS